MATPRSRATNPPVQIGQVGPSTQEFLQGFGGGVLDFGGGSGAPTIREFGGVPYVYGPDGFTPATFNVPGLGAIDALTYYSMLNPPAAPAQPRPQLQIGRNGEIISIDPLTGQSRVVGRQPSLGEAPAGSQYIYDERSGQTVAVDPRTGAIRGMLTTGFPGVSPDEQRRRDVADVQGSRDFTAQQAALDRALSASAQQQAAAYQQASLAQRAQEVAQSHELSVARFAFDRQQAQAAAERQRQADRLGAARQYAELISAVDPNAADAYLAAGGGVASNAIAQGGDALSTRAILPAAQSLRVADDLSQPLQLTLGNQAPIRFAGGPVAGDGVDNTLMPGTDRYNQAVAEARQNILDVVARGGSIGGTLRWGGTAPNAGMETPFAVAQRDLLASGQVAAGSQGGVVPLGSPGAAPSYSVTASKSQPAGVNSKGEPVHDGGFIAAADGFSGVVDEPTLMLVGEGGPEAVNVAPQDEPYVNRTLAFRRDRPLSSIGSARSEFDPRFFSQLTPEQRARFAFSRQTRYGIPAEQTLFDASRFRLPGFRRDQVQIGA